METRKNIDIDDDMSNLREGDEFNLAEFNKQFEKKTEARFEKEKEIEYRRLKELNNDKEEKEYKMTPSIIIIGIKDTVFFIINQIIKRNFNVSLLLEERRLFFLGFLFLIFSIILSFIDLIEI